MQSDHLLGDLGNQMYTTYPKIPEKRTGTPPASCCACAHPREPLQGQVISRQNTPKKTAGNPVAHARAQGNPSRSRVPTFCTITILRKKARGKSAHAHTINPATAGQGRYW